MRGSGHALPGDDKDSGLSTRLDAALRYLGRIE